MEVISKQEHIMVRVIYGCDESTIRNAAKNMQNSLVHTILC